MNDTVRAASHSTMPPCRISDTSPISLHEMHVRARHAFVNPYEVRVVNVGQGVRRLGRRIKTTPLVQRHYHPLMVRGVGIVGRHPSLHRIATILYRLVPGLQGYLRRFLPETSPPGGETTALESQLRLVPAFAMAKGGSVTLEELALIARTL